MCFDSLVNGEHHDKPIGQLLREELTSAFRVGSVAALIVVSVLWTSNTPVWLVVSASVGALILGVALYQAVLVAGLSVLRLTSKRTVARSETTT